MKQREHVDLHQATPVGPLPKALAPMALLHIVDRMLSSALRSSVMSLHHVSEPQVLLHITDEEMFPWHEPPQPEGGLSIKEGPDGKVWRAMYEAAR